MFKRLNEIAHRILNAIQHLVGNPIWVLANTLFFVVWMVLQLFLRHPLDPPAMFFPGTVWLMTVMGYIIELAMKAQNQLIFEIQQKQAEAQQAQMDRIEAMAIENRQMLEKIDIMAEEARRRDEESARRDEEARQRDLLLHDFVEAFGLTVDKMAALLGGAQE